MKTDVCIDSWKYAIKYFNDSGISQESKKDLIITTK